MVKFWHMPKIKHTVTLSEHNPNGKQLTPTVPFKTSAPTPLCVNLKIVKDYEIPSANSTVIFVQ